MRLEVSSAQPGIHQLETNEFAGIGPMIKGAFVFLHWQLFIEMLILWFFLGSNVLPGEGSDTDYPILRLAIDIFLGGKANKAA